MPDSKDYWKELLGDDAAQGPSGSVPPAGAGSPDDTGNGTPPAPADDTGSLQESGRFRDIPLTYQEPAAPDEGKYLTEEPNRQDQDDQDTGPENFRVDFDFDGEYRDAEVPNPIRFRREKRTGCVGGILYALFIICVGLAAAALLWLATTDIFGFGKETRSVEITIPDDYDIEQVTDILYENNIIKYKWLFKLYAKFSHAEEKISSGTYQIISSNDYFALVNGLTSSGGTLVETDLITIPEGFSMKQIFELLERNEVCSADELWECAANHDFDYSFLSRGTLGDRHRLEGFLFPDTYKFYVNDEPERVIDKFLANFKNRFSDEYMERAGELGYSVKQVLTIASMIEREAADDDERDLIASVIYNRLRDPDSFPYLQIDATIYYAIEETGEAFSLDIDSPYNTYTSTGLPPGPICSPGNASIRAALYPQETEYYYYALSTSGYHEFFTYRSAFEEFVNSDEYGG